MIRLHGVQIPDKDKIEFALTHVYGIGQKTANKILEILKIDKKLRAGELSQDDTKKIGDYIEENLKIEGDLREEIRQNIKRLKEAGTYRGLRHFNNLPARGQRTRSNARTKRGKRRTVGSMKKEDAAKMQKTTSGAPVKKGK